MNPQILIVDDEPAVLEGLQRQLRRHRKEWQLHLCTGYESAMETLSQVPIDAIVSDVNMPGRDGFVLLADIRKGEHTRDIPVVIFTGAGDRMLKRRALELGATDLLSKPVDIEDLIARISNMLRLKQFQDEIRDHNVALETKVRERTRELENARVELIWRLGRASEYRDNETGNHIIRVGYFALTLAGELGLDPEFKDTLFLTAPLHDVGKIGIPDRILLKPGKLTQDEWKVMRKHTQIGADILKNFTVEAYPFQFADIGLSRLLPTAQENPFIQMAANISLGHHERWDGGGYPHQVRGEDIPIEARITTVADVFDALCSKRPYKEAMTLDKVLAIMRRGVGTQFDPEIFAAFERCLDQLQEIQAHFPDDRIDALQADLARDIQELMKAT